MLSKTFGPLLGAALRVVGAAVLAGAAFGCAPALVGLREAGLPPRARVEGVPAFAQAEGHCGPAALAALLTWAGRPETPEALAPLVFLPARQGTLPIDLPREIRARGLLAYTVRPEMAALLAEAAGGHPALVLENQGLAAIPAWHYSVLAGYDLEGGTALLYSGAARPEEVRLATFAQTWGRGGRFALLALPPGELPAGDDPDGVLSALADLEEAHQFEPAARGYESFLRRWPGDWRGAFGWGNALYALGDRARAEQALRRAHATDPDRPEPLNNLAFLVFEQGRHDEAEALARMAIENAVAAGLPADPYEQTLSEVTRGR